MVNLFRPEVIEGRRQSWLGHIQLIRPVPLIALTAVAANVSFVEVETDKGHDAFLLHEPELFATLRGFLTGCAEYRGSPRFWEAAS